MRISINTVKVSSYKSGPNEGEMRPIDLPDDAVIVEIKRGYDWDLRGGADYPNWKITYYIKEAT